MKKAFSLVELLVVIGIIAILAGVILGTFSGSTDSARDAHCLANLHNLAAACQSYGVEFHRYPAAGSFELVEVHLDRGSKAAREYSECKGWISWNSRDAYRKDPERNRGPSSHKASASWNISAYSSDEDARMFSITNGAVWKYVNCNHDVYICPLHAQTGMKPNWSYAMNAYFRWDHTRGTRAMPIEDDGIYRYYGDLARADRRLLFAEIPFKKIDVGSDDDAEELRGEKSDSVLQYKGSTGCKSPETIGFNHGNKKYYYAHVAFADGHTEKLVYPKSGMSDEELKDLTRWLCEGIDISFDGRKYKNLTKDKKSN